MDHFWNIFFILILNQEKRTRCYGIIYLAYLMIFGFNKYVVGLVAICAVVALTDVKKNQRVDIEELSRK